MLRHALDNPSQLYPVALGCVPWAGESEQLPVILSEVA